MSQYSGTSTGYRTKNTVKTDVGTVFGKYFYSKQSKRFMCVVATSSESDRFTPTGVMSYKIYRSKEYAYEDIDWKTLDWKSLFNENEGGELVLEQDDAYLYRMYEIGKEIVITPKLGPYINSGSGTSGEPILKHPYSRSWGSLDGGTTWQGRETGVRDEAGNLTRHYIVERATSRNYISDNIHNDGFALHVNFASWRDTEDTVFDDDGGYTYISEDPKFPKYHALYHLPYSVIDGTQQLFWNGVQIQPPLEEDGGGDTGTPIVLNAPLNFTGTISNTWDESYVVDGQAYTFRTGSVTDSSWNQVFMTQGWIRANCNLPEDATDVTVMDCSGNWVNTSYGSDSRVSLPGESKTVNGVLGVLVNFTDTSTISSSRRQYRVNLPDAVQYIGTLEGSGIIPLN